MRKIKAFFTHHKGSSRFGSSKITPVPQEQEIKNDENNVNDELLRRSPELPICEERKNYDINKIVEDAIPPEDLRLLPCHICGRTFLPDTLVKHSKICLKAATKKRKQFDSSRQRREGTELAQYLPKNFGLPEYSSFVDKERTPPPPVQRMTPKPKQQTPTPTPTQKKIESKLLATAENKKCPHCGRAFGARAWDRHVAWCAERTKLFEAPGYTTGPKEVRLARSRLMARTSYRAPAVKSRRSLTREKYSLSRSASVDSGASDRSLSIESFRTERGSDFKHLPVIKKSVNNINAVKEDLSRSKGSSNKSRSEDIYDPYLSAKQQMLDLMASSTNLARPSPPKLNLKNDYPQYSSVTSNPVQHSPRHYRDDNTLNNNNSVQNSNFQRTRSLRSPSKYSYNGKFEGTPKQNTLKSPIKPQNNICRTPSVKVQNKDIVNKQKSRKVNNNNNKPEQPTKSPEFAPRFPNRTEKHKVIKLEPVEHISSKNNRNVENNNLAESDVYSNNLSLSHESFIDPRLINDPVPLNVQKLLDNASLHSGSSDSLVCENFPKSFSPYGNHLKMDDSQNTNSIQRSNSDNGGSTTPTIDDLSVQYDKIMVSLERSISSQFSQDEDSLYNDLEELMTSLDDKSPAHNAYMMNNPLFKIDKDSMDGLNFKKKSNNSQNIDTLQSDVSKPQFNKSISLNFSSPLNNSLPSPIYPTYMKRSNSHQESPPKETRSLKSQKQNELELENDIMQSLKDIDMLCESKVSNNKNISDWLPKERAKEKTLRELKLKDLSLTFNNTTNNKDRVNAQNKKRSNSHEKSPEFASKSISDSAYGRSSLSRSSPLAQTVRQQSPTRKTPSMSPSPRISPNRDRRSESSSKSPFRDHISPSAIRDFDIMDSRCESRLSSSGSERSTPSIMQPLSRTCSSIISTTSRLSKFCHECGSRFPLDSAKFCIDCGVRRLMV